MAGYFLDTSALVRRYVKEIGRKRVVQITAPPAGHMVYISQVALVEVAATLCRMSRESPPRLTVAVRNRLIALFLGRVRNEYAVVSVDEAVFLRAANLCRVHPLRAYDAVQLACALTIRDSTAAAGELPPTFVCADLDLLDVAQREGLAGENPATQP